MRESLSAKDIERAEFSTSLRGYDRDEVDAFLRTVADEHRQLSEALDTSLKTADKPYQRLGADMGELLQHAKDSADQLTKKAEEEAKQSRQDAKQHATAIKEKAEREAGEIKQAAEYEASEHIKAAERRVGELMGAERDARRRLHEIQVEMRMVVEKMQHAEASLGGQTADEEVSSGGRQAEQEGSHESPSEAETVPVDAEMGAGEVQQPVDQQEAGDDDRPAQEPRSEKFPAV
jgi:cell division initiation protein